MNIFDKLINTPKKDFHTPSFTGMDIDPEVELAVLTEMYEDYKNNRSDKDEYSESRVSPLDFWTTSEVNCDENLF